MVRESVPERSQEDDPRRYERFVTLFARIHDNLFSYIFSLLPHWSDAEDVFQQASLVLWRKFDDFQDADEKGDRRILPERPSGCCAQNAPVPFFVSSGCCAQNAPVPFSSQDVDNDGEFLAWACRVAFFEVQNFRRTAGRDRLMFDNDLVEQMARQRDVSPQRAGRRRDFLMECIAKLSEKQRELLNRAYEGEDTIGKLAEQMNRSPQTIYNRLNLIRRALFECVEETVRRKGAEQ